MITNGKEFFLRNYSSFFLFFPNNLTQEEINNTSFKRTFRMSYCKIILFFKFKTQKIFSRSFFRNFFKKSFKECNTLNTCKFLDSFLTDHETHNVSHSCLNLIVHVRTRTLTHVFGTSRFYVRTQPK